MEQTSFDKVMAVNLDGVVSCTRAFWPALMAAAPARAAVVNTSSVAGFYPPAGGGSLPYVVSKFAVRGFSEGLAEQCLTIAPHGACAPVCACVPPCLAPCASHPSRAPGARKHTRTHAHAPHAHTQ